MNLFKTFTLKWGQAAIFKLGMWAAEIAVGACLYTFFSGFFPTLIAIAAVCLSCTTYVWATQ